MKKICIAQGGRFLLGINAEAILARSQTKPSGKIIQLSALLAQQPGGAVSSEAVYLELQSNNETFFLLVDRIVEEAEVIHPPGPLPSACPRLAVRLCPQVTIWGDTPVLLLDPAQVLSVAAELGEGIGLFAEESVAQEDIAPEEVKEEQPAIIAESIALPENDELFFPQAPVLAVAEEQIEEKPIAEPVVSPKPQQKEAATIDEETFKKVMTWTIACFKQNKAGEELHLGIDQLPSQLAGMVEQKGLNENIIQYLIDQIVLRCKESENAGRRLPEGEQHAG